MADVKSTIEMAAAPERVWEVVTDLQRLGEWVTIHRDFAEAPPTEVERGTSFHQTLAVAGTPFTVAWTATEVEGPRRLAWQGEGPMGSTASTVYELTPSDGGTRFDYTNEFALPGGAVGEAAGDVVRGQAEREADASLARLKNLVEA